jgi:hypothetical protein
MRRYKLYFLDRNDFVITVREFVGKGDQAALDEAKKLRHTHTIDIVSGTRKVARIEKDRPQRRTKKPAVAESSELR